MFTRITRSAAYHLGLALQGGRVTLGDLADGLRLLEPLCAAGRAAEAERAARIHLVATQELLLEHFDNGIVTVSSAQARQAIQSSRQSRI